MARNKFAGVDDIYFTPKSICTVKLSTVRKGKVFYTVSKKKYHPKTRKNVSQALAVHGYISNKGR